MNPVEEGSNQFSRLFDAMPARRIGKAEDIAGVVIYLCSQAGVSERFASERRPADYAAGLRRWSMFMCRWRARAACEWTVISNDQHAFNQNYQAFCPWSWFQTAIIHSSLAMDLKVRDGQIAFGGDAGSGRSRIHDHVTKATSSCPFGQGAQT